jgi:hypothetical protein
MIVLRPAVPDMSHLSPSEHPLGFRKVELLRLFGFRVRVHVWHGDPSEAPHDHRWAFVGIPLWGRFVDVRWRVIAGCTHAGVTAWPSTASGGRRYSPAVSGPVALVETARHVRRPLRPYVCRHGAVHSAVPVGAGRHVSLVLLGRARSETSLVWVES